MKPSLLSLLLFLLLAIVSPAFAEVDVDVAPFINKQIKELTAKITSDLASGALTQTDADELRHAVAAVKNLETSEPSLTPRIRVDMREKLSAIAKDLQRKEAQAKALSSSSSPSPSATAH